MPSSVWPCGCGPNGSSTTVASTCDTPRTFVEKLYQASVRSQYIGRFLLASWTRSKTLTVPDWTAVRPLDRVPSTSVRNCHDGSVSTAEPMPTKLPPFLKYASKLVRCASVSGLARPVLRNTTLRYESRFAGVNCAPTSAGAGAVTTPALPTAVVIALTPAVVNASEVLVTTSTLYG